MASGGTKNRVWLLIQVMDADDPRLRAVVGVVHGLGGIAVRDVEGVLGDAREDRAVQAPGLDEDMEGVGAIFQRAVRADHQVFAGAQAILEGRAVFDDLQGELCCVGNDDSRE